MEHGRVRQLAAFESNEEAFNIMRSDPTAWGGTLPVAGQTVTIPSGS